MAREMPRCELPAAPGATISMPILFRTDFLRCLVGTRTQATVLPHDVPVESVQKFCST